MLLLGEQDQVQALTNTFSHLIKGGRLAVSLLVPTLDRMIAYKTSSPEEYKYVREFDHPNGKHRIVELEQKRYDEYRQIATHRLKYITVNAQGIEVDVTERVLVMRWTYRYEFQHLARYCGFETENIYGDYRFTRFCEASKEMIWVLRKSA